MNESLPLQRKPDSEERPQTPSRIKKQLLKLHRKFFCSSRFNRLNNLLHDIALQGMGLNNAEDLDVSGETLLIKKIASSHSKQVVFDIGSHEGEYSAFFAKCNPQAAIFAFEPHPTTFKRLCQTAQASGFQAVNLALSDSAGDGFLYDTSQSSAGTKLASLIPDVATECYHEKLQKIPVRITTVAEFCAQKGIDHLDLLKVDAEGNEFKILRGAKPLLDANKIDLVQFEMTHVNSTIRVFLHDFAELLPQWRFYRLLSHGLLKLNPYYPVKSELFVFQNVLAVRPDYVFEAY